MGWSSALYFGSVCHRRHGSASGESSYPLVMTYLDLNESPRVFDGHLLWSARRPAPVWLRRGDYLGDPRVALPDAARDLVGEHTGVRPDGPVRLLTHPRCFGVSFDPVNFYYCYDTDERLAAVLVDVANTPWGKRRTYVLPTVGAAERADDTAVSGCVTHRLHVSPLKGMDLQYEWRLTAPGEQLVAHIASRPIGGGEPLFDATLSLTRHEIDSSTLTLALVRCPLWTTRILAHVYSQALRVWLRGADYCPHPTNAQA